MAGPNSQQRGKEQRGGGDHERSLQISHPGRITANSRRACESGKGLQGSTSDQKQILKALPHQQTTTTTTTTTTATTTNSCAVPHCTSPAPIKQTTPPQLNLQIPGPQTRSRCQRQNPVKTMKRHTSPYPTPASSPNGDARLDGLSVPPRRSDSCPGITLDLTGKYTEKMVVFLQSIRPKLGGDDDAATVDSEPVPENGMEVNPVPDFFVNPTQAEAKYGGSWMAGMGESPERDLMDNEFIGTLGSVRDLDEEMRDWLPSTTFSEFMPGPEEPIQEATTPIVMLQNMDLDRVASTAEIQRSTVAREQMETSVFLHTPQSSAALPSDSGIGSPASVRYQLFTPVTSEDMHQMNASVNSSAAATFGLSEAGPGGNSQMHFGELGELTPPSSAHRSPSPSSVLFIGKEPTKQLAPESIEIIETTVLDSMLSNPALHEFSGLCKSVKQQMHAGRFGSLRDVEKDLWFRGRMGASSSSSGQLFCFESMNRIREVAGRIPERDLYRREDLVYGESYFTDKFAEIEQICVDSANQKRNQTPVQTGSIERRPFSTAAAATEMLSKGPMIAAGAHRPMTGSREPFHAQQRQRLEIQTQSLVQPLYCLPQENLATAGSTFTVDQRTNNAVAQAQYHNARVYRNVGSGVLLSSASFGTQAAAYHLPPTPVSAGTVTSTGFALPAAARQQRDSSVPASAPDAKDEPSALGCGLCGKRFQRRCDLTKHEKTHARPFKCALQSCKYHTEGFPTNKERERHQNDIHASDSREWRCDFPPCQYKSKRESNCKQHMEKAHHYVYKRMKRNPRKRDNGVIAPVPVRRRRNVRAAPSSPAVVVAQRPGGSVVLPRAQPRTSAPSLPEHNPFSASFGYVQPRVSELGHINLLESGQIQAISISGGSGGENIFPEPMEMDSFYEGSPATAVGSGFDDYSTALHSHHDNSPTLTSEDYFPMQSAEYINYFDRENSFGVVQPDYQQSIDFQFGGLDFGESSDCERQGDTPD